MEFKIARAVNQQYYFVIVASNGRILAKSEEYHNLADCEHAIDLVIRDAGSATVKKVFPDGLNSLFRDAIRSAQTRKY